MGFLASLFGKRPKHLKDPKLSQLQAATREQTRRQLLAMALRDTLKRNDLAADCITAEGVAGGMAGRDRGMHVQLIFSEWQPGLLSYVVALEQAFRATLRRLDPLSPTWMLGITWRFEPRNPMSWPQLPTPRQRKLAELAQAVSVSGGAKASRDTLLQSGDAAFRKRSAAPGDFAPTQPMQTTG